jgi:hypothetical protein
VVFLSACGGNARLKQSDYAALHSVSVLKESDIPDVDHTVLTTFSQIMAGSLGGVLGAAISLEASSDPRKALHDTLVKEKIDPGLMVSTEFEQQIRGSGLFPVVREPADAQFRISIQSAGLSVPGSFATRLDPAIYLQAQLVRRDGTVIWHDWASVYGDALDASYTGHPLDAYFNDPNLLRSSFQAASHAAASMLLDDLKHDLKRD